MPDGPSLVVAKRECTGRPRRPHVHIEPAFLSEALNLRGPSGVAPVLVCSARTVRRRALEAGLVEPVEPVYQQVRTDDGAVI